MGIRNAPWMLHRQHTMPISQQPMLFAAHRDAQHYHPEAKAIQHWSAGMQIAWCHMHAFDRQSPPFIRFSSNMTRTMAAGAKIRAEDVHHCLAVAAAGAAGAALSLVPLAWRCAARIAGGLRGLPIRGRHGPRPAVRQIRRTTLASTSASGYSSTDCNDHHKVLNAQRVRLWRTIEHRLTSYFDKQASQVGETGSWGNVYNVLTHLSLCSMERQEYRALKTTSEEQCLCGEPWRLPLLRTCEYSKRLNDSRVHDVGGVPKC